ncbi:NAD+ kinase [Caminicella sporogenes DSM 14501]|uniref:NAD kinase n=1 Tax=Caminicella sporogenes DSM 14501 TaxID=1121266 RepID=A0A1M6MGT2_9FIRM|nr:NAD(+)/NADH kinase [Caminicella sporogenes]RKD27556.1 NAD(+) kinase [Caminicella sporogenes]WIF94861.1 NAD(+)/NADH kinase [Caminicella sporogenes]SHJ82674.1 NAD+ kinase [Caminicella sporogenes DSM 14501]
MEQNYRAINIVSNNKPLSLETARILKYKLEKNDFIVPDVFDYNAELIICIGGDGSFLRTVHKYGFPNIPIVGINTGHLGFFQELSPYELDEFIYKYKRGEYFIDKINPVEGIICTRKSCIEILGINEIVIKGDKSTTIHLNLSLDKSFLEKFSGDGILISTPTGSTAYNYSLGGSIVDPRLNLMQITPIAPINTTAYRSFTSSIVVPKYSTIKIHPEYRYENSILIISDGMEYRYSSIVEIQIKLSELEIQLMRLKEYNFWNRVKEKFL